MIPGVLQGLAPNELGNVHPVAHTVPVDPVQHQQLLFRAPVLIKDREIGAVLLQVICQCNVQLKEEEQEEEEEEEVR